jgi:uncharacterized phage protein gp47/JayE
MAGLTSTGITIKSVDEIIADMVADQIANIDANLNTESDSILGQLNGIYAAALAELWELLEQVYQAAYPDTASGQSLSYIAALTGAIRRPATKSTILVHLEGTVSTSVPAGTQAYPDQNGAGPADPDSMYETTAVAVIAEEGATDYVEVTMEAVTPGSYANATLAGDVELVISTPVAGLDAITIQADSADGDDEETDSELRKRREQSLALAGASTVEAIRAEMLQVTGVDRCTVFENPTGTTDALGLPPKSIEVLVDSDNAPDYDNQELADEILLRKPAGTQTYGSISETADDSAGNTYTVYWSEPTTVPAYVELDLTAATDGTYGDDGDDRVAEAIADWATPNLTVGRSLYSSDIVNVVADVEGVTAVDVLATFVDDTTSPNEYVVVATGRDLITISTSNITVNS